MRLMRLTSTMKIKKTRSANAGQVSIEALLLWAALAGMLALFTPAFAHAMDAYTLLAHTNQFTSFADELQKNVEWLSFAAPGSQLKMLVPALKEMEIIFSAGEIELILDDESFSHAKTRTITSAWPIEGTFSQGKTITILREEGKITIR